MAEWHKEYRHDWKRSQRNFEKFVSLVQKDTILKVEQLAKSRHSCEDAEGLFYTLEQIEELLAPIGGDEINKLGEDMDKQTSFTSPLAVMDIDEYEVGLGFMLPKGKIDKAHWDEIVQAIWQASQARKTRELDRYLMNSTQFSEHYKE